jgi:hypothetical protein
VALDPVQAILDTRQARVHAVDLSAHAREAARDVCGDAFDPSATRLSVVCSVSMCWLNVASRAAAHVWSASACSWLKPWLVRNSVSVIGLVLPVSRPRTLR